MFAKKAFTLIEVMVVLTILALVAVLGYSFFGSVYQQAKTEQLAQQLHKDLGAYATAYEQYLGKYGDYPAGSNSITSGNAPWILSDGFLRDIHRVPAAATDPAYGAQSYYFSRSIVDGFGKIGYPDIVLYANYVKRDVCIAYNKLFVPALGERYWWTSTFGGTDTALVTYGPRTASSACARVSGGELYQLFYFLND